ncbi:LTA synthase family protein [Microbacteriaceae bacterium 4G12]
MNKFDRQPGRNLLKAYVKRLCIIIAIATVLLSLHRYVKAPYSPTEILSVVSTPDFIRHLMIITVVSLFTTILLRVWLRWERNYNEAHPIVIYLFLLMTSVLMTCFLLLSSFAMQRNETMTWLHNHPYHFVLSVIYVCSILLFLFSVLGNYYFTALSFTLLCSLIGIAHIFKTKLLGHPLYPSDFKQIQHILELLPMISGFLTLQNWLLFFLACIVALALSKRLPMYKMSMPHRLLLFGLSGLLVLSYYRFNDVVLSSIPKKLNFIFVPWDQIRNYGENGLVLGLATNFHQNVFEKPPDYNKENVIQIAKDIAAQARQGNSEAPLFQKQPNIVYLMSEAFWDPTSLPSIQFSEDPIPFIRSLMNNAPHGKILSPMFGGGTANVEFEALTGFSMSFLEDGATPYQQVVNEKSFIPTIVSVLKHKNYETIAIHPFEKSFYKRNYVYETFGFHKFISNQTMRHQEVSGSYISDLSLSKEIMDTLKQSNKPLFIHSVSMQNHLSYPDNLYPKQHIRLTGVPKDYENVLHTYVEGLRQTNLAFEYLAKELQQLDEPTIVVFWGDHLPLIDEEKMFYKQTSFITNGKTPNELRRLYETPVVMYANFPLPKQDLGTISPIYLNPILLKLIGDPLPPYYTFLEQLRQELSGLKHDIKINSNNQLATNLTSKQKELLHRYQLIQYDLLIGKQYTKDILFSNTMK